MRKQSAASQKPDQICICRAVKAQGAVGWAFDLAAAGCDVLELDAAGRLKPGLHPFNASTVPMAAIQYVYTLQKLSKTYPGGKQVLKDISLSFLPGAKIGVVGVNGSGKSTLMRVMAGQEKEFLGEAWAAEGIKVGYLPQEPQLDPSKDVLGNAMEGVAEKKAMLDRYNEIAMNYSDETAEEMAQLQDVDRRAESVGSRSAGRAGHGRAALPAPRCRRFHPVRRRKAPRGAVPAAAVQAGHPAAGRADQPSRRRDRPPGWSAI